MQFALAVQFRAVCLTSADVEPHSQVINCLSLAFSCHPEAENFALPSVLLRGKRTTFLMLIRHDHGIAVTHPSL